MRPPKVILWLGLQLELGVRSLAPSVRMIMASAMAAYWQLLWCRLLCRQLLQSQLKA
jgi:hypothetical protein